MSNIWTTLAWLSLCIKTVAEIAKIVTSTELRIIVGLCWLRNMALNTKTKAHKKQCL